MSESAKNIIKLFCDRFFDLDYYPTTLKAVLELSVERMKDLSHKEVLKLNSIGINKLRDLNKIENSEIEDKVVEAKIDSITFYNSLIAARLIGNAWSKRNEYLKKAKSKMVITGLDYAGKTSLINRLMHGNTYSDMINLEPTIGANIEEFQSDKLNLVVWDLGGQKSNIEEYLIEPEKFFIQVDILVFVIDSQDDARYDIATKYLNDLIDILDFIKEKPFLMILLNKADSDITEDPDFQIKLEYLVDSVTKVFTKRARNWSFEITPTSIYNLYSNEPEIAKTIKNIFSLESKSEKDKMALQIDEKLQKILDVNLRLMDKVATELSEIKRILNRVVPADMAKSIFSVPFDKVPSDFITDQQKTEWKEMEVSTDKKKEKKEKDKKKKKGGSPLGVPKRTEIPKPASLKLKESEEKEDEIKKDEKVDTETIQTARKRLIAPVPPPPPPKVEGAGKESKGPIRAQVISELKEMFIKRGLVKGR